MRVIGVVAEVRDHVLRVTPPDPEGVRADPSEASLKPRLIAVNNPLRGLLLILERLNFGRVRVSAGEVVELPDFIIKLSLVDFLQVSLPDRGEFAA